MPVPTSPAACGSSGWSPPGTFSLDGGTWEVENNVWVVGDDTEVLVIDAAHDAGAILRAVDGGGSSRCCAPTGTTTTSTRSAELVAATGATAYLHPDDRVLWDQSQTGRPRRRAGRRRGLHGRRRRAERAAHPGPRPRGLLLPRAGAGRAVSGDTLFNGGPGATGRSYSDFPTIVESIRARLLDLPAETVVLTGHGDATTIGAEAPHLQEWIARGH